MSEHFCSVLLDRVQAFAWPWTTDIPDIPGFEVRKDFFVRQQTTMKTYNRVRIYENLKTKSQVYVQRKPACPWLAPFKLTVVTDAEKGVQRSELKELLQEFKAIQLLTIEVALDFPKASVVDKAFVLRHGIFGKSRLVLGRPHEDLRFGTRHSDTMVRAYKKNQIPSFRVELELHSSWLRKHGVRSLEDISKLGLLLPLARIQFAEIDWESVQTHLLRRGQSGTKTISQAKSHVSSIHQVLNYLRKEAGFSNVHRFLRPLSLNRNIWNELRTWSDDWRDTSGKNGG